VSSVGYYFDWKLVRMIEKLTMNGLVKDLNTVTDTVE
jgi:hypothetical protein